MWPPGIFANRARTLFLRTVSEMSQGHRDLDMMRLSGVKGLGAVVEGQICPKLSPSTQLHLSRTRGPTLSVPMGASTPRLALHDHKLIIMIALIEAGSESTRSFVLFGMLVRSDERRDRTELGAYASYLR